MEPTIRICASTLGGMTREEIGRLRELTLQGELSELRFVLERERAEDLIWMARANAILGWCAIYRPFQQPHGYRFMKIGVYVDPTLRNHGIGTRLINATADTIVACGVPVHAVPTSDPGQAFFKKFQNIKLGSPP